jgi:hypothetical protein
MGVGKEQKIPPQGGLEMISVEKEDGVGSRAFEEARMMLKTPEAPFGRGSSKYCPDSLRLPFQTAGNIFPNLHHHCRLNQEKKRLRKLFCKQRETEVVLYLVRVNHQLLINISR